MPNAGQPSVLVWGAGAIGGTIGAHLVRAGRDVTFADLDRDHVMAIRAGRLCISGPVENFSVRAPAFIPDDLRGTFDLVLLAVKSQHTAQAVDQLRPHLATGGSVVSCQNGLNELIIEQLLGRERTIGCYVGLPADRLGPGEILYGRRGELAIGSLDGSATRALDIAADVRRDFYSDLEVTPHILDHLWSKMAFVAVLTAASVADSPTLDFMTSGKTRPVWTGLVREMMAIAATQGIRPIASAGWDPEACVLGDNARINVMIDDYVERSRGSTKTYSGIWRDLAVHKRKTEIPTQFRPILDLAQRHALEAPLMKGLLALVEQIEAGDRQLDSGNLDQLASI